LRSTTGSGTVAVVVVVGASVVVVATVDVVDEDDDGSESPAAVPAQAASTKVRAITDLGTNASSMSRWQRYDRP
jgi:hypothetical protein